MISFSTKNTGEVKIFTDNIEEEALKQIYDIAESPFCEKHIRIMPDVHAGKGITIGFSGIIDKYINPEHVGCDIGCNVTVEFFNKPIPEKDYALFEHKIKNTVPMGFNINEHSKVTWKDVAQRFNKAIQKARSTNPEFINDVRFVLFLFINIL